MFKSTPESSCVNNMFVNVLTRNAVIEYKDGSIYNYENVPFAGRFEYAKGLKSVGSWVNTYLLNTNFNAKGVTCEFIGYNDMDHLAEFAV